MLCIYNNCGKSCPKGGTFSRRRRLFSNFVQLFKIPVTLHGTISFGLWPRWLSLLANQSSVHVCLLPQVFMRPASTVLPKSFGTSQEWLRNEIKIFLGILSKGHWGKMQISFRWCFVRFGLTVHETFWYDYCIKISTLRIYHLKFSITQHVAGKRQSFIVVQYTVVEDEMG